MKKILMAAFAIMFPANLFAIPAELNIGFTESFPLKKDSGLLYGSDKIDWGNGIGINSEVYVMPLTWLSVGVGGTYSVFDGYAEQDAEQDVEIYPSAYTANLAAKLRLFYSDNFKFYIPFGAGYGGTKLSLKGLSPYLKTKWNNDFSYYAGLGIMWKMLAIEARYTHLPKPYLVWSEPGYEDYRYSFDNRFDQISVSVSLRLGFTFLE